MTRARSGKTVLRGRKRMRKLTKGFRLSRHNLYRQSVVTLIRGRVYAFRDRRVRKREFRRCGSCASTPPAGCAACATASSSHGLQRAKVELDRKTLADLAVHDPDTFTKIVELAQAQPAAGIEMKLASLRAASAVSAEDTPRFGSRCHSSRHHADCHVRPCRPSNNVPSPS